MTKRKPVCALNIAPYYLDKSKWAVSTMKTTVTREGCLRWITQEVVATFPDMYTAGKCAISMSNNMKIPMYMGLVKRDPVTDDERAELEIYGLIDRDKTIL